MNGAICVTFMDGKILFAQEVSSVLENKEVRLCEMLVMFPFVIYLTSHVYSSQKKYSPLMSHSWNYPSQMISPRLVCWIPIAKVLDKGIKHGKNEPDVDRRSWQRHYFHKHKCFWDYQSGKQMCFCQEQEHFSTRLCLLYINLEPFLTEEAGFTTIYKVHKYCHHCSE